MLVPSPLIAAIGSIYRPISALCLSPPHFPKKRTPLGLQAVSRSMMVAALADPIPKFIMLRPLSFVAVCIGHPLPFILQPNLSANLLT